MGQACAKSTRKTYRRHWSAAGMPTSGPSGPSGCWLTWCLFLSLGAANASALQSRWQAPNAQAPKAAAGKSRIAPKAGHPGSTSIANLQTEVARLARERDEALDNRRRRRKSLTPLASRASLTCRPFSAPLWKPQRVCAGDKVQLSPSGTRSGVFGRTSAIPPELPNLQNDHFCARRASLDMLERRPVQIADVLADPDTGSGDSVRRVSSPRTAAASPGQRDRSASCQS